MRRELVLVTFPGYGTVSSRTGDTILDAALDNGIPLEHECGGNCSCTTCHVYVVRGAEHLTLVEEPEAYRLEFASDRRPGSRLACQALVMNGPVTVEIPEGTADGTGADGPANGLDSSGPLQ